VVTNGEAAVLALHGGAGGDVREAEHVAQQGQQEGVAGDSEGVEIGAAPGHLEVFPEGLGDAEVAAQLVLQAQAPGHAVVGVGLLRRFPAGDLGQVLAVEEAALHADGIEGQGGVPVAGHECVPGMSRRADARRAIRQFASRRDGRTAPRVLAERFSAIPRTSGGTAVAFRPTRVTRADG
jgi:hypothetical protein